MSFPENELKKDFVAAKPDEMIGAVIERLVEQGGSDYSFILIDSGSGKYQACQVGKLRLHVEKTPPELYFRQKISEFPMVFSEVPAEQSASSHLGKVKQLAQRNPLHLVVLLQGDRILGYYWLVSRTVYSGQSFGEILKSHQAHIPEGQQSGKDIPKAAEPPAHKKVVNTGFSDRNSPGTFLDKTTPLKPAAEYYFCLGVGEWESASIEATPAAVPDHIPAGALLQVVLFSFENELEIDPKAGIGLLQLTEGGNAEVVRQPGGVKLPSTRLLFPVRTPSHAGCFRLRCNIYYQQCLIQSRLVSAQVFPDGKWHGQGNALVSVLDYNLSQSMSPGHLAGIPAHQLSLMINVNANGTHGFRFFGKEDFKTDAAIDGHEIQDLIQYARAVLKKTAWGDEKEYAGQAYRYAGQPDLKRLQADLINLAIRGYRIYDAIIQKLAGGRSQERKLAGLMRDRGLVQIALKESARFILPAALIYDYPLETGAKATDFNICPQFLEALKGSEPLEKCACFEGNCPSRGQLLTICPSGFWGFRHDLGLPLSLGDAPDAPTEITVKDSLNYVMSVCLDPDFTLRPAHESRLQSLVKQAHWKRVASREETFDALKNSQPHLVYFYCHGGLTSSKVPYILIGELTEIAITRDNFRARDIFWEEPRPLIFINGCHTTAVEPESAFELVSGFVETANAAGVIGTEITIFEPLATAFAESFLLSFSQGVAVGESIRRARLALLKQSNPLGLVYIPYTMASLQIKPGS